MLFCSPSLGQILVLPADMAGVMENYNVFPRGPSNLWQYSLVIMHLDPASDND